MQRGLLLLRSLTLANARRKTISVSMFAAAILYSAPSMELSIYSTCKRISQKLLRNVQQFLSLIHEGIGDSPMQEIRCNMEELVLQGPEGPRDIRKVNSYPSKVRCVGAPSEIYLSLARCECTRPPPRWHM